MVLEAVALLELSRRQISQPQQFATAFNVKSSKECIRARKRQPADHYIPSDNDIVSEAKPNNDAIEDEEHSSTSDESEV
ncbi:hypothetical protein TNIN_310251 [Trichonephila inaurata madagascariensis]|uniref:Uncharacterized protein n=1 Tax=Trichonephila inaurata madagascariensis TaxID=2747483 RepID=A0A8X6YB68_9ARAC|nr:hypothetical protein TNIN_310251 [Trichonephila inaurata madagascariensis]